MTFQEYDLMNERCIMYRTKALEAIVDIAGLDIDIYYAHSYLSQCSEDTLSYNIESDDGFEFDGEMKISILELYLKGYIELAKQKYKGN